MAKLQGEPARGGARRKLIDARQYVLDSDWGEAQPTAETRTPSSSRTPWSEYAAWHLGLTEGATDETKARYAFVYGDFRRVHRTGLIACVYRAAEWRHKEVELAAHELLAASRQGQRAEGLTDRLFRWARSGIWARPSPFVGSAVSGSTITGCAGRGPAARTQANQWVPLAITSAQPMRPIERSERIALWVGLPIHCETTCPTGSAALRFHPNTSAVPGRLPPWSRHPQALISATR